MWSCVGRIPWHLGLLGMLGKLDLSGNELTGSHCSDHLLSWLRQTSKLLTCRTGRIPSEIGLLRNLEVLSLKRNQLTGSLLFTYNCW